MLDCFKIIASKEEIRARVRAIWCDLWWHIHSEEQFMLQVFNKLPSKLNIYFLIRDVEPSVKHRKNAKIIAERLIIEFKYSLYFHYIVNNISNFCKRCLTC